jgi:hypothetical protein
MALTTPGKAAFVAVAVWLWRLLQLACLMLLLPGDVLIVFVAPVLRKAVASFIQFD